MQHLIDRLRRGDATAASDLVEAYGDRLFAHARARLGGCATAVAEEVVQETLIAAVDEIDAFDAGRGEFFTWLCMLARNPIRAARRREGRAETNGQASAELARRFAREALPADRLDAEETRANVGLVLGTLSEHDRRLLTARYVDGRSVREIADGNGKSAGAVKQSLARARAAFRAAFLRTFPEEREETTTDA